MAKDSLTDSATDESIRAYLKEALEHLMAAGHATHELVEFALDKFGKKIIPHLNELQEGVHQSRVKIQNLTELAKTAVFGLQISAGQREQMIRDAAYLRAEQRNFAGERPEEDWRLAEREIDELLEKQAGLIEKARKNIESVSGVATSELAEVKVTVRHWLETRGASAKKAG